jgi:2-C-methyl-D-erythritol 4-phosphate cytidylyltransferase
LPEKEFATWKSICSEEKFDIPHKLVTGGKTRFHSVRNALKEIVGNSIVAIHDGVRPLVSKEIIANAYQEAERSGSAIPVIDIFESVRYLDEQENYPVNRQNYKLVQTPQVFLSNLILSAYQTNFREEFTDDASVFEYGGMKVNLIDGNPENIKITTKKDLAIAETLLDFV